MTWLLMHYVTDILQISLHDFTFYTICSRVPGRQPPFAYGAHRALALPLVHWLDAV
jgi:hypothetical protein